MNLSEARVDLDGLAVAEGQFRYPLDDKGIFVLQEHTCVRFGGNRVGQLSATNAQRDPLTGFLVSTDVGIDVTLPGPLREVIEHALRFEPAWPQSVTFSDHEHGSIIHSSRDPIGSPGKMLR